MMLAALVLGVLMNGATPAASDETLRTETEAWRKTRESELSADRGWLSVSGLPWLKEGETSIGSGEKNQIRLGDGPESWGVVERAGKQVTFKPADGPPREALPADEPFQIGRTWIQVIRRSDLVGLRLWDPKNERKLAFHSLRWFDVKDAYRVTGRLVPSATPSTVKIANVIGQVNDFVSPGVVEFELNGKKLQLTPVYETKEQKELFYIFKDGTSAKTTYGAGRFVYSALPDKDGVVILDFNRAYSPPCAFTDFATCPLPPSRNRLDVAIEAGELDPHPSR
jgi:uncharacterized protein (DUF1684 family)